MVAGMVLEPAVLRSSFEAVTELLTCCGLGVFATRVGLLDAATTRALARCVFNIFLPAMLSTSVARTVASGASFSTLLPLPLCALVQVILGLGIVTLLLGGPKEVRTPAGRDVAALASFGNSGVLPLVFANCLFRSAPDLLARANSLVAMFLLGWSPLFWTLGYSLLAGRRGKHADGEEGEGEEDAVAVGPRSADEYWHELRKRVLTPPIMGCLAGIVVGAVPPLRALLVPAAGSATALFPLPLHRCIEAFGKACKRRPTAKPRPHLSACHPLAHPSAHPTLLSTSLALFLPLALLTHAHSHTHRDTLTRHALTLTPTTVPSTPHSGWQIRPPRSSSWPARLRCRVCPSPPRVPSPSPSRRPLARDPSARSAPCSSRASSSCHWLLRVCSARPSAPACCRQIRCATSSC